MTRKGLAQQPEFFYRAYTSAWALPRLKVNYKRKRREAPFIRLGVVLSEKLPFVLLSQPCWTLWPPALSGQIPPIMIAAKTRCIKIRHNSGLLPACSTNPGQMKAFRNSPRWIEVHWFVLCGGNRALSSLSPLLKHTTFFYSSPTSRKAGPHLIGANSQFKSTAGTIKTLQKQLQSVCYYCCKTNGFSDKKHPVAAPPSAPRWTLRRCRP